MARPTFPPLEDDFTQALLRSAEADEPSRAAYGKAAAALGVGAGLGVGASLAAPPAVAAGMAGIARWSGSTAVRAWAFGVSGALLVGGGALLLGVRPPSGVAGVSNAQGVALHAPLPQARPVSPAAVALARSPIASPPAEVAALAASVTSVTFSVTSVTSSASSPVAASSDREAPVSAPRVSAGVHRAPRPASASSIASASSGSSLAEQVQSLDRARVALGSGAAASALQEIAHYRKAWPQGVFLTEASVLEVEALAARGQRSLAAARAAAFVAAHPDSPQAERLRRLIPAEKP